MPTFLPQIGSRWTVPVGTTVLRCCTLVEIDDDEIATLRADDGAIFTVPLRELLMRWTRRRTLPVRVPEAAE